MSRYYNGSAYLTGSTAPVSSLPLTMSGWFRADNATATVAIMSLCVNTGSNVRYALFAAGATAGDPVIAQAFGTSSGNATTSTGYTASTWTHACGVFNSSTSRTAYINGGGAVTDTSSQPVTGINRVVVGSRIAAGAYGSSFAGQVAMPALWNVALTAAEIASLAAGVDARKIRPANLVWYLPPENDLKDIIARMSMTDTSSTADVNPRIYF